MKPWSYLIFSLGILCSSCNHDEPETTSDPIDLSLGSTILSPNQILYTTIDDYPLDFFSDNLFISNIKSHVRNDNGVYLITFEKDLTLISASQFSGQKRLKGIQLPNGIYTIEPSAFANCSNLNEVYLPNSLKTIERGAFSGCSNLLYICLGESLTEIQKDVFKNCINLTQITIPESVKHIDGNIFYGCKNLSQFKGKFASTDYRCLILDGNLISFAPKNVTTYQIPSEVISIGTLSIISDELSSLELSQNITKISSQPLKCEMLSSFKGKYASSDNRCIIYDNKLIAFAKQGISEYSVPAGVEEIDNSVFSSCNNLTRIELPNSLTKIGNGAFSWCSNLNNINLPNSLTIIGNYAFNNCHNLVSVCIPDGLSSIGENAFEGCFNLIDINLPASIKSIGRGAFWNCSNIESIIIPQGLKEIEEYTFYSCTNLNSINIPESINKIGDAAFSDCGFNQLNIPNNVSYIGAYAFHGCTNLEYLELGTDIVEIHDNAFNCWNLEKIYCHSSKPATLGNDVFTRRSNSNMQIYVPEESLVQYKTNKYWEIYSDFIVGHKF